MAAIDFRNDPLYDHLRRSREGGYLVTLTTSDVIRIMEWLDNRPDAVIPHPVGFEAIIAPLATDPNTLQVFALDPARMETPLHVWPDEFDPATQGFAFRPLGQTLP